MSEYFVTAKGFLNRVWERSWVLRESFDYCVVAGRHWDQFYRLRVIKVQAAWPLGQRDAGRLTFGHGEGLEDPRRHLDQVLIFLA